MNYFTGVYSCPFRYIDQFLLSTLLFCIGGTFFGVRSSLNLAPSRGWCGRSEASHGLDGTFWYPVGLGKMTAGRLSHAETMLLIFEGGNRSREQHSPLCVPQGHIWGGGATVYDGSPRTGFIVSDWGCTRGQLHAHRLRVWTSYGSGVPHTRNRLSLRAFLVRSNEALRLGSSIIS